MPSKTPESKEPDDHQDDPGLAERTLMRGLDKAIKTQAPAAIAYVDRLSKGDSVPNTQMIVKKLDRRYLTIITASGAGVGVTAMVPGFGTVAALGAISVESAFFLEATAFYTIGVAHAHGLDVRDDAVRESLVMAVMLGSSGTALLTTFVGSTGSTGGLSLANRLIRLPGLKKVRSRLQGGFVARFATKRAGMAVGKLAPAGVGAVIGGWGNRKLGKTVIRTARETFGAP